MRRTYYVEWDLITDRTEDDLGGVFDAIGDRLADADSRLGEVHDIDVNATLARGELGFTGYVAGCSSAVDACAGFKAAVRPLAIEFLPGFRPTGIVAAPQPEGQRASDR